MKGKRLRDDALKLTVVMHTSNILFFFETETHYFQGIATELFVMGSYRHTKSAKPEWTKQHALVINPQLIRGMMLRPGEACGPVWGYCWPGGHIAVAGSQEGLETGAEPARPCLCTQSFYSRPRPRSARQKKRANPAWLTRHSCTRDWILTRETGVTKSRREPWKRQGNLSV